MAKSRYKWRDPCKQFPVQLEQETKNKIESACKTRGLSYGQFITEMYEFYIKMTGDKQ